MNGYVPVEKSYSWLKNMENLSRELCKRDRTMTSKENIWLVIKNVNTKDHGNTSKYYVRLYLRERIIAAISWTSEHNSC